MAMSKFIDSVTLTQSSSPSQGQSEEDAACLDVKGWDQHREIPDGFFPRKSAKFAHYVSDKKSNVNSDVQSRFLKNGDILLPRWNTRE